MKVKLKKKKMVLSKTETASSDLPKTVVEKPRFNAFADLYRAADSFPAKHRVLSQYYDKIWGKTIPDKPLELVRTKISYELLRQDYEAAGEKVPTKVLQNINASARYDLEGLTKATRQLVQINLNQEKGESTMVKKNAKGAAASVGVAHLYLEVFDKQASRQWTDDQIASFIKEKTGTIPSAKNVASYRCMYNQGSIRGQGKKPKEKIKAFRGNGSAKPAKSKSKTKLVLKKKKKAAKRK